MNNVSSYRSYVLGPKKTEFLDILEHNEKSSMLLVFEIDIEYKLNY